ncbi:MAG: DUF2784 domain-containing protein [Proteobacteria bacterium]|nr:DUF2784 domain-containing protein [Pseudomonadota bacterium]MBU1639657.1 DUF2784 domain-containing protein [Pseudomonadota bacterium]
MTRSLSPQLAGDLVVILHLLYIVFVGGGGLLVLRWPRLACLHLPAALWGAMVEIQGWTCPLTPLEAHFRQAAGQMAAQQGFIAHYIMPLVYPPGLTRQGQIFLGIMVVAVNLVIYYFVLLAKWRGKQDVIKNRGE